MIRLKRAFDPASKQDGVRFLVERLWLRGVKKDAHPWVICHGMQRKFDREDARILSSLADFTSVKLCASSADLRQ